MSEAKTTRDIFAEIETRGGACSHYPRIQDVRLTADSMTTLAREGLELLRAQEEAGLKLLDDLHAIPGADAVVTEEGLEAAAEAAYVEVCEPGPMTPWCRQDDGCHRLYLGIARVVLKAAGIVVVKEIGTLRYVEGDEAPQLVTSGEKIFWLEEHTPIAVLPDTYQER